MVYKGQNKYCQNIQIQNKKDLLQFLLFFSFISLHELSRDGCTFWKKKIQAINWFFGNQYKHFHELPSILFIMTFSFLFSQKKKNEWKYQILLILILGHCLHQCCPVLQAQKRKKQI